MAVAATLKLVTMLTGKQNTLFCTQIVLLIIAASTVFASTQPEISLTSTVPAELLSACLWVRTTGALRIP